MTCSSTRRCACGTPLRANRPNHEGPQGFVNARRRPRGTTRYFGRTTALGRGTCGWRPPVMSAYDGFPVTAVAFGADATSVFTGGIGEIAKRWDARAMSGNVSDESRVSRNAVPTMTLRGHADTITGMRLSPDGTRLLTNGADSSLRVWDVRPYCEGDRCERTMAGHAHGFEKALLRCAWSPAGARRGWVELPERFRVGRIVGEGGVQAPRTPRHRARRGVPPVGAHPRVRGRGQARVPRRARGVIQKELRMIVFSHLTRTVISSLYHHQSKSKKLLLASNVSSTSPSSMLSKVPLILSRAVVRRPPPAHLRRAEGTRPRSPADGPSRRRPPWRPGVHAQPRPRLLALLDHAVGDVERVAHAHVPAVHHAHARALAPLHGVLQDGQVALLDEVDAIHGARLDGDVYVLLVVRPLLERARVPSRPPS